MARSFLGEKEIKINKARIIENAPIYKGIAGQVVGKSANGFIVKTKDSTLEIIEFEFDGKIRVGDRFQ
jgi:methionyl-tRNA formyltransferase